MLKQKPELERAITEVLQTLLKQGVRIEKPNEVAHYLQQYPDLLEVLEPIVATAQSELPDAQLTLQVYYDPEIEDEHLVLYARFKNYSMQTMERIERARALYREELAQRGLRLPLTTDFALAE